MDLFDFGAERDGSHAPLADRMRPRTLEEVLGQDHIIGAGKALSAIAKEDHLPSLLLWGPPGSGKTTIARVLAGCTRAYFMPFSAVLGGVKELRELIDEAKKRRKYDNQASVLFIDEIHRFNKAQQDALLPHVEKGVFTLIGATTENPSFQVNAALLSRLRVYVLKPLTATHLAELLRRALADQERGLGQLGLEIAPEALEFICQASYGDARRAISALEVAASAVAARQEKQITLAVAEEAVQQKALLYDKSGEEHYNVISAFIKSLRGSDPDAAVYWMTRMVEAGEDPLFILRRMIIFASEDIGNSDPRALAVAVNAMEAFRFLGLPEGILAMSQAALYLATAPKSNSALTTWTAARQDVSEHGPLPVPLHLRNAPTSLMKQMDYGKDYKYPHDFAGHHVQEEYLPEILRGKRYYQPSDSGYERTIRERLDFWRKKP